MSIFRDLENIQINVAQGGNRMPLVSMLTTLYSEVEPIDHALANFHGQPLIQVNMIKEQPERAGKLIQSVTADGFITTTGRKAIAASISLSQTLGDAPVTFTGNGRGVTVTGRDDLDAALDKWRAAPAKPGTAPGASA